MFLQSTNTVALHGRSFKNIAAVRVDFFETLVSWAEKFCHIFQQTHILNTAALKTDAAQHCAWIETRYYITEGQKWIYKQQTPD